MPTKLSSFLGTGKNKRIMVHKHVCSVLGIDTEGKAPEVKDRIIKYVGKDSEKDSKVREIVTSFLENDGELNSQSQEFSSLNSYRTSSVAESEDEVEEDENEDDDNEVGNDKSELSNKITSTPLRPSRLNHNDTPSAILTSKLTEKIQSWMGIEGNQDKNDEPKSDADELLNDAIEVIATDISETAINVIETSFAALTMKEGLSVDPPLEPKTPEKTSTASCEFTTMMVEFKKVVACKDSQIKSLEQYSSEKEAQLTKMEDLNRILLNKLEATSSNFITQSNSLLTHVKEQQDVLLAKVNETLSSDKIERLAQTFEKANDVEKSITDRRKTEGEGRTRMYQPKY